MTTSEQINEVAAACAKAQLEMKHAAKTAVNPAFRSKYADFASIVDAARVYAQHGIAVWQDVTLTEQGAAVVTRLAHTSGQWIEFGPLTVPLGKRDAHGVGSATTYAKRYALSAALGIAADEDDDGNAAVAPSTTKPVAVATVPAGYADWLLDIEVVAEQGTAKLQDAWKASRKEYRDYIDPKVWASIKAKASKVAA